MRRNNKRDQLSEQLYLLMENGQYSPREVADAFFDAVFHFGHESGHECERERARSEDRKPRAPRKKKPFDPNRFFTDMGVEPPKPKESNGE